MATDIPMSDDPGHYDEDELRDQLRNYLSQDLVTAKRIRDVLLPTCLVKERVTREELKRELVKKGVVADPAKAGYVLTVMSGQIGMQKNDFLRQVLAYDRTNPWEKDNYHLRPAYRKLVEDVLHSLASVPGKDGKNKDASQG